MAARVFAGRYQVKLTVLHAFEFALRDAGFRRVTLIIGRIDRQERGLNPLEAGRGVVVARSVPLVKKVIGIAGGWHRQALVDQLVGLLARGSHLLVRERSSARRDAKEHAGQAQRRRLSRVVAVVPFRVAADRFEHHPPQHPIAARHGRGLRRHGHQHVHEVGILFAPKPRVHAAHGIAEHEAQVTDAEPLSHEPVLGFDHVIVIVLRKFGPQAVRWLRRFSGAERV
jgi:hypothetical protein